MTMCAWLRPAGLSQARHMRRMWVQMHLQFMVCGRGSSSTHERMTLVPWGTACTATVEGNTLVSDCA